MLLNPDGTPYKLRGSLQQFDPSNKKYDLFNHYDAQVIRISGSPIYYYETLVQLQTVNRTYMEDRGKIFSPHHVLLYAVYEPPTQANASTIYSADSLNEEIIFEVNYKEALTLLGQRQPKIGSRIYTPHRGENWILVDYRLDQFKYWGVTRLMLLCAKWQESTTQREGNVSQNVPPPTLPGIG